MFIARFHIANLATGLVEARRTFLRSGSMTGPSAQVLHGPKSRHGVFDAGTEPAVSPRPQFQPSGMKLALFPCHTSDPKTRGCLLELRACWSSLPHQGG